jgi:Amidohydrolase family
LCERLRIGEERLVQMHNPISKKRLLVTPRAGCPRRSGYGRDAGLQLQPLPFIVLAHYRQDSRRKGALPGEQLPRPDGGAAPVYCWSSWCSSEESKKGSIIPGQLADLSVLSADYFSIPTDEVKRLESLLTVVGGKIVYAGEPFARLAPPPLPWSPVRTYGGYASADEGRGRGPHCEPSGS